MTGYTPKVGDKVRCTLEEVVSVAYRDGDVLLRGGELLTPGDGWSFELIEAAPVPFEMGRPLTAEMGEPPVGSIIIEPVDPDRCLDGVVWHRRSDGLWYGAAPDRDGLIDGATWGDGFDLTSDNTLLVLGTGE